jgi:hypothetical protein
MEAAFHFAVEDAPDSPLLIVKEVGVTAVIVLKVPLYALVVAPVTVTGSPM